MNDLPKNLGLVKLPSRLEIILYLIKAELKNRKFIKGLEQVGFDTSFCSLDLSTLILSLIGFTERPDHIYDFYNEMLELHIQQLELNAHDDVINKIAFDFYYRLESKKEAS